MSASMQVSVDAETVAVGTVLADGPRTDPSVRNYRTGLLPRVRTSTRNSGKGCITRAGGSHRVAMRSIRVQLSRVRWLRRRSALYQFRGSGPYFVMGSGPGVVMRHGGREGGGGRSWRGRTSVS